MCLNTWFVYLEAGEGEREIGQEERRDEKKGSIRLYGKQKGHTLVMVEIAVSIGRIRLSNALKTV